MASHFEKSVYENYVMSARPPPMVCKLKECEDANGCQISDVIRCRKRALELNTHKIAIFSPLDKIELVKDFMLGDVNFVSKAQRSNSQWLELCYTQGWQHRCLTEFLLHHGIIAWEHVTHKLNATAHYPPDTFQKPLHLMEEAWEDTGHPELAKRAVNSLIGLWAIDENFDYRCFSSGHEQDSPKDALKSTFHYKNGLIHDFVLKEKLDSGGVSNRYLHDLCMCSEHVRVGSMLYALKQSRCILHELKTDSCLFRPPKRRKICVLEDITYQNLNTLRDRFEGPHNRLNEHCAMCPSHSEEKVFRVQDAVEDDLLKSNPKRPGRSCKLTLKSIQWNDLSIADAESKVITKNQSLLVLGSPGTGKTTLLQGITERLRSLGKTVDIFSKTHCASARAGGCTADHWIRKKVINGTCSADFVWIDEISQLDCELIAALNRLTYTNVAFLISGDFNQFAPIGNSFRGCPVEDDAFERSNLLHRMANGNRLILTECKRSDSQLFDFYTRLIPGGDLYDQPIEEAVPLAREKFTYEGVCDLNLVLSHRKRIAINRKVNVYKKPDDAVFLPCPKLKRLSLNAPQEMWIWPELELLGCLPIEKQGVRNGVLYKIESITDDTVHFEGGIPLSKEDCVQLMRLSHCMTYASVQGRECDGSLCLHDCNNPHFTHKHLYVSLPRAKMSLNVRVE